MVTRRRLLAIALLAGVFVAMAGTAAGASPRDPEDQVVLSGTLQVPRGRTVGEVVVFHGTALIQGVARGDVVVLDGRIVVSGQVSGSVINVDGPVVLQSTAQIRGDVRAGGSVIVREGAEVAGSIRQNSVFTLREPLGAVGRFLPWLAVAVSLLVLGLLLLLLVPRAADAVVAAARSAPWASIGWGLAAGIGLPTLAILALASLLGLPLGLSVLLALALFSLVGYAWSAWILGRLIWGSPRGRVLAFLIGWAIVSAVAVLPYVGAALWLAGAVFGMGTTVVAAWRARGVARGRHRAGGQPPSGSVGERASEEVPTEAGAEDSGDAEHPSLITEGGMDEEGVGL